MLARLPLLLLVAMVSSAMGCSAPGHTLTVLSASSLREAAADLKHGFVAEHPDVQVHLVFAGSQALALQVRQGLRADVYASAHRTHLDALVADGLLEPWTPLARNELVIATRAGEPLTVQRLPTSGTLVLAAPEVPAGHYADLALMRAGERLGTPWLNGVRETVVSREPNVRMVAAKVAMGEADAAIIYRTDAEAFGLVSSPFPESMGPTVQYGHAALTESPSLALAHAWLSHAQSEAGRDALAQRGFVTP